MSDSKLRSLGSLGSKAKQVVANIAKFFLQTHCRSDGGKPQYGVQDSEGADGHGRSEVTKAFRQGTLQASRWLWSDCYKEQDTGVLHCSPTVTDSQNKTYKKKYGNIKRNINATHIAKQSKLHEKKKEIKKRKKKVTLSGIELMTTRFQKLHITSRLISADLLQCSQIMQIPINTLFSQI